MGRSGGMAQQLPWLIAGAGIAGLAAAIGLARHGHRVHVLERRAALSEIGAGIQIGPNGVKALGALGLRQAVEQVADRPDSIGVYLGRTGGRLTTLPLGASMQQRHGVPYLTLLRADLQSVLLKAARDQPGVTLELGFDLAGIAQTTDSVSARASDGRILTGVGLIGADGLWSQVRALQGDGAPPPSGMAAFRALLPRNQCGADRLPTPFFANDVGIWLGSDAHVVHYPVGGGSLLNLVVIVKSAPGAEGWDEPGGLADLSPHLAGWPAALLAVLQQAPDWRRWHLFERPAARSWSDGRILCIGDAAHPVLPFLAQGAVLALEDAAVLAGLLGPANGDPAAVLARFEHLRRPRTDRVAAASRRNAAAYHLRGPAALARNGVLRVTPPALLLGQYDWLYGYDPREVAGVASIRR